MALVSECIQAWWSNIDWATTANWVAAIGTCGAVIVAVRALKTWKAQLRQQERYQKGDALIRSYHLLMLAGFQIHWSRKKVGNTVEPFDQKSEEYRNWQNALMQYRVDHMLAHLLFENTNSVHSFSLEPDDVQKKVIHVTHKDESQDFYYEVIKTMTSLLQTGIAEIQHLRAG